VSTWAATASTEWNEDHSPNVVADGGFVEVTGYAQAHVIDDQEGNPSAVFGITAAGHLLAVTYADLDTATSALRALVGGWVS